MPKKKSSFERRFKKVIKENLNKINQEINETKELAELLNKSISQDLTEEEKAKVKEQLYDILKTIPALAIFLVPFGTLILAILIKYLPFNILPSAFASENEIEKK